MIWFYGLTCIWLVEEIAEILYKRTNRYKKSLGGTDRFKNIPHDIEICSIGSGPGLYAISFDNTEKVGFNFCTAPQSFSYGYKILKNYADKIKENAVIIVVIMCPLSFGDNRNYKNKNYSDKFYNILPPSEIEGYSIIRHWKLRHPLLFGGMSKIKKILFQNNECLSIRENSSEPNVIYGWKRQFDLINLKDASQSQKHEAAFEEKIKLLNDELNYCYEKGWHPVLVVPPIPKSTSKYISNSFAKAFVFDNIKKIMDNNSKIKLLSYYNDDRFDESMFMNDIFMNEKGKNTFTNILMKDLEVGK